MRKKSIRQQNMWGETSHRRAKRTRKVTRNQPIGKYGGDSKHISLFGGFKKTKKKK